MSRSVNTPDPRRRLRESRRTLQRVVLRRRRLLAALCLAVAAFAALRSLSPDPAPTVTVVTAAHDLQAGAVLVESDLTIDRWPADAAPAGASTTTDAVGRTVTGPLRTGEPITDTRLMTASLLDGYPGLEAVPVRIPDADAASLLRVGDQIDLLATDPRGGDTSRVGERLPILALPQPASSTQGNVADGTLVVVGTTPAMSEIVASASATSYLTALISR